MKIILKISLIPAMLLLMSTTCTTNTKNCHRTLTVANLSDSEVYFAMKTVYKNRSSIDTISFRILERLKPGEFECVSFGSCWEYLIQINRDNIFYFLKPYKYGDKVWTTEDSLSYYYDIRKIVHMKEDDIDSLRKIGFTISYP